MTAGPKFQGAVAGTGLQLARMINQLIYLSIHPYIHHLPYLYLSVCPSVHPSIHPSIYLFSKLVVLCVALAVPELYRSGWPTTQRSACLCLESAVIKGTLCRMSFLKIHTLEYMCVRLFL